MSLKSRRVKLWGLFGIGLLALLLFITVKKASPAAPASGALRGKTIVVYRSPNCGCCANYITYLRRAGLKVEEKFSNKMTEIKKQYGVPASLESCHTARIGDYTVEGHIPLEAIEKLVADRPALAGIGLPGMPSGSPGMPGAKYGAFEISGFTAEGSVSPFVSL